MNEVKKKQYVYKYASTPEEWNSEYWVFNKVNAVPYTNFDNNHDLNDMLLVTQDEYVLDWHDVKLDSSCFDPNLILKGSWR